MLQLQLWLQNNETITRKKDVILPSYSMMSEWWIVKNHYILSKTMMMRNDKRILIFFYFEKSKTKKSDYDSRWQSFLSFCIINIVVIVVVVVVVKIVNNHCKHHHHHHHQQQQQQLKQIEKNPKCLHSVSSSSSSSTFWFHHFHFSFSLYLSHIFNILLVWSKSRKRCIQNKTLIIIKDKHNIIIGVKNKLNSHHTHTLYSCKIGIYTIAI